MTARFPCRSALLRILAGVVLSASLACNRQPRPIVPSEEVQAQPIEHGGPGAELLHDTARRAVEAGASPLEILAEGVGVPGDSISAMVYVPEGRCALLVARGGPTVEDLDLLTYGEDGTQYGVDEAPDDLPTLLLCPDESRRIFVGARVAQGKGPIALGLQDVPERFADRVASAVGARNHPSGRDASREPWPRLEDAVTRHRDDLGGQWVDVRRVALPVDSRVPTRVTAEVPAERCLDVLALPGEDVAHLDLLARDETGRIFARARPRGPNRSLLLCATDQPGSVGLEVRPHAGRGVALLVLSTTKAKSSQAELDPEIPRYPLGSPERISLPLAESHDDQPLPPKVHSTEQDLTVGRIVSSQLGGGGCHRVDFAPKAPLIGYEAHAWGPAGHLVGEVKTSLQSTLFLCQKDSVRLDLEATRRAGPLVLEARRERGVPQQLLAHPLAASRLLGKAHALGFLSRAKDIGDVESMIVEPDHLQRFEIEVPTGHCQTVMAGLDAGAWGASLHLIDAQTGLNVGTARGAHAVAARACAPEEKRRLVVELHSTRGNATALVSSHGSKLP